MYTSSYKQSSQIFTNFDFAANCRETTNLWSVVLGTILRTIFKVTASVLFGMDGFEESPSCFWPLWESAATAKQRGAVRVPDGVRGGAVAGGDSPVFRFLRAVLVLLVVVGCGYLALDAAKVEGLKEDPQGHRRLRVAARTYRRGRCSTVAGRKGTSQRPFFSTLDTIVE